MRVSRIVMAMSNRQMAGLHRAGIPVFQIKDNHDAETVIPGRPTPSGVPAAIAGGLFRLCVQQLLAPRNRPPSVRIPAGATVRWSGTRRELRAAD